MRLPSTRSRLGNPSSRRGSAPVNETRKIPVSVARRQNILSCRVDGQSHPPVLSRVRQVHDIAVSGPWKRPQPHPILPPVGDEVTPIGCERHGPHIQCFVAVDHLGGRSLKRPKRNLRGRSSSWQPPTFHPGGSRSTRHTSCRCGAARSGERPQAPGGPTGRPCLHEWTRRHPRPSGRPGQV